LFGAVVLLYIPLNIINISRCTSK